MSIGSMSIRITGDISDFNKNIASVQKTLNAQTKGLQTVARSMTTVGDSMVKGITLPILAVGAGLLKLGNDFDDAYDRIRIDTGATGDALAGLQNDFRAVAKVAPSSFNDISIAVSGYNKTLGLAGEANQKLSTQILNLSRLTKTDLNANVENSSKLFNNWKISTENQGAALDLIFRAGQKAKISVTDLMAEVSSSGPILRTMGYDFETSTALIAGFQKAGIEVQSTIAAMKIALKTMAKEGFTDPQEVLATYVERIKGAKNGIEATGIAAELFGAKGGAAMAAAIREGRLNLDDLIASLKLGKDSISEAAKATEDWQEKLLLLRNNLALAIEPLATKVFESLGRMIEGVTPKIEGLAKKFGDLTPEMQDSLLTWAGMIAIGGPLVSFLGRATTGILSLYKSIVLMNTAGKGSMLLKIAQYAPELALALGLIELQANSSAEAFKNFELVQTKLRDGMYLFSKAPNDVRVQMQLLQDEMKVVSKEGAEYLRQKIIALSNDFLTGKITAEDLAHGLDVLHNSVIPATKATEDLTNATVGQIIATQNNEATITSLMEQTGKTREEVVKYATEQGLLETATDDTTEATDKQREEIDKLRSSFNQLIADIFGGITTYNDFQEAGWAVEAAEKALATAIKEHGANSQEAMQAENDLDDAKIAAIETSFKLSNEIGATTAEQEEARKKAVELGLQYVATGGISVEAFLNMAAKFGMSAADIIKYADDMDININYATRFRLIQINADASQAEKAIVNIKNSLDSIPKKITSWVDIITTNISNTANPISRAMGGPVGFSGGGILDKILSASQGIKLPKFDNGGVLAMLHPPEIVLNKDNALNVLWNMAQPNKNTQPAEDKGQEIVIKNTLHSTVNLDGKVAYENWEKYDLRAKGERVK